MQGCNSFTDAPVPPYLHYQDQADEEESCPQPSALPAALAASRPATHQSAASQFRFHSHPPLPSHPLLRLNRPVPNSPVQAGPASEHDGASNMDDTASSCSPQQDYAETSADGASVHEGPPAIGPGHNSPSVTAGPWPASSSQKAAANDSNGPAVHNHVCDTNIQKQSRWGRPHAAGMQQQQQQASHDSAANSDIREEDGAGPHHTQQQENLEPEEQDHSDSDNEYTEMPEHQSEGAVGDDELLDHEPDMCVHADAASPGSLLQPQHLISTAPAAVSLQQGGSSEHDGLHETSTAACTTMPSQHAPYSSNLGAAPAHHSAPAGRLQPVIARHALQQQQKQHEVENAAVARVVEQQVVPGVRRGQQEHVSREPSRLKAAYRGQKYAEQQQQQHSQLQGG